MACYSSICLKGLYQQETFSFLLELLFLISFKILPMFGLFISFKVIFTYIFISHLIYFFSYKKEDTVVGKSRKRDYY
jgi:hypothetical protein